jgi:hypothetical protein
MIGVYLLLTRQLIKDETFKFGGLFTQYHSTNISKNQLDIWNTGSWAVGELHGPNYAQKHWNAKIPRL